MEEAGAGRSCFGACAAAKPATIRVRTTGRRFLGLFKISP
jgi:hypothetical protein